jgi:hypothetical protein
VGFPLLKAARGGPSARAPYNEIGNRLDRLAGRPHNWQHRPLNPAIRDGVWCRMDLEYIFLARFADLSDDGLFTVHGGGMKTIVGEQFPVTWPLLCLVARVRATPSEFAAPRRMAIERVAPTGDVVVVGEEAASPSSASARPGVTRDPDGRICLNICAGMLGQVFPVPGVYQFRVKMDGKEIGATNIKVSASR